MSEFIGKFGGLRSPKILRDPDSTLDYVVGLENTLGGDVSASVDVVAAEGVSVLNAEINLAPIDVEGYGQLPAGGALVFWLDGGVSGVGGRITFRVRSGARVFDMSFDVINKSL